MGGQYFLNQTLRDLSDRGWFVYGRPGDYGYSAHLDTGSHFREPSSMEPRVCTSLWKFQWRSEVPVLAKSCKELGCSNSIPTWLSYWEFRWPASDRPLKFNHIHGSFY